MTSRNPGGRPPKFNEPSRPVTLTLPERILDDLGRIDEDRGRAIVKATEAVLGTEEKQVRSPVEIVRVAKETGLLVVESSSVLRRIPFLSFIEIAPARHLLAMEPGNDFKALELALRDLLEDDSGILKDEAHMLRELLRHIRGFRKAERVSMAEILCVRLKSESTPSS